MAKIEKDNKNDLLSVLNYNTTILQKLFISKYNFLYKFLNVFIVIFLNIFLIHKNLF